MQKLPKNLQGCLAGVVAASVLDRPNGIVRYLDEVLRDLSFIPATGIFVASLLRGTWRSLYG